MCVLVRSTYEDTAFESFHSVVDSKRASSRRGRPGSTVLKIPTRSQDYDRPAPRKARRVRFIRNSYISNESSLVVRPFCGCSLPKVTSSSWTPDSSFISPYLLLSQPLSSIQTLSQPLSSSQTRNCYFSLVPQVLYFVPYLLPSDLQSHTNAHAASSARQ